MIGNNIFVNLIVMVGGCFLYMVLTVALIWGMVFLVKWGGIVLGIIIGDKSVAHEFDCREEFKPKWNWDDAVAVAFGEESEASGLTRWRRDQHRNQERLNRYYEKRDNPTIRIIPKGLGEENERTDS